MRQLALPFAPRPGYAPEDFCPAPSNAEARRWLDRPESWPDGRLLLWGEAGCGKSHLLHIWAAAAGAALLDGARPLPPRQPGPLALDDADLVSDETAFLHMLNAAAEAGDKVLLAARLPPARRPIRLPDLASRLRASLAAEIRPPEEELLAALLVRLEAERQLRLSPPLRNLLLTRLPRRPDVLREAVARLDRAGLARGTRLTAAAAAGLLADLMDEAASIREV